MMRSDLTVWGRPGDLGVKIASSLISRLAI